MEHLSRFFSMFVLSAFFVGCGVKGVPLPPLKAPPIGRGEPTYSEATQKEKDKKKPNRKQDLEEIPSDNQGDL